MKLIVGCPVANRAWILERWYEHIEIACMKVGVVPHYVHVYGTSNDTTRQLLLGDVIEVPQDSDAGIKRNWNLPGRYEEMTRLRNILLGRVRGYKPDFFWSVDSDILVAPTALQSLIESVQDFDAVGGKCFMTPVGTAPSYAFCDGTNLQNRVDRDDVIATDVIMAIQFMKSTAYKIDYRVHPCGEDVGWSLACAEAGLTLGWDGRVTNNHIMRIDEHAQPAIPPA